MVHKALGDYRCIIEELVAESDRVFAKMKFTGIHQGEFLGYSPTQQRVSWSGCALFTFRGDKVADLWVLGDLKSLEKQLADNRN
ncbi:MAG: ester cyclase [Acidiferrobacterales bacterium]